MQTDYWIFWRLPMQGRMIMRTLNMRLEALELKAKSLPLQNEPVLIGPSIEEIRRQFDELRARNEPALTPEEQTARFRATFARMIARQSTSAGS
jgi:hypothetical protein